MSSPTLEIQYISLKYFIGHNWEFIDKIQEKYMELLSNLSNSPKISEKIFIQNVFDISERGIIYIGYLGNPLSLEFDSCDFEIVSTGTLFLEPKLSHGGRPVGHIEDIIVHPNYRGRGLSFPIIQHLLEFSKERNCYKTILQCKPELCGIYERSGFEKNGVEMVYRFL